MTQILGASLIFNVCVAFLAVYFSFRHEQSKKELEKEKKELSRKAFETFILHDISDKIGYSLNIKAITETIALSVEQLFDLSTISYALVAEHGIKLKTFSKEPVTESYTRRIKEIMHDSMKAIDSAVSELGVENEEVREMFDGMEPAEPNIEPQSYFNIPLVVHNKLVGLITVSSQKKHMYQEEDMTILYRIVNQAERAIERLENVIESEKDKLNAFILSLPSGAILFSFHHEHLALMTINSAAKEFLRIHGESNTLNVLSNFGPDNSISDKLYEAVREKKSIMLDDVAIFNKSFKIFINPLLSEHNSHTSISVTMQDVSMEKELEKMRSNFTNMVVHELRSPLVSIKGASNLLLHEKMSAPDKKKMLEVIDMSSRRMLDEVSELLDAAKIEAGKFSIVKENADMNAVIKDRYTMFTHLAKEKDITLSLDLDPALPQFGFDPMRVGQVVDNLLSNSIKYTSQGGQITLKTRHGNGQITVLVKDNGLGIPNDKKELLFSKFGQIQGTAKKEGTGLGLYISKGIIESHNGTMWVESEEGKGTSVYFTLPLVPADTHDVSASSAPQTTLTPQRVVN